MAVPAVAIPLRPDQQDRLVPVVEPRIPEPAQLYSLLTLTFVKHTPVAVGNWCNACGALWPCTEVRLAFRLREGF